MILSTEQQALIAQLVKKQSQPAECFQLISSNAKTRAFGEFFVDSGLIKMGADEIEFTPAFAVQAYRNGITDDTGELTEDGKKLSQQKIEETYRFLREMLSYVS